MKYVVTWDPRPNVTEEGVARSLQVFGKWVPSEGVAYKEFLGRVDGSGGYAVVETDDAALITKDITPFTVWFDFKVVPVLEIADATVIDMEAVAFLQSIS